MKKDLKKIFISLLFISGFFFFIFFIVVNFTRHLPLSKGVENSKKNLTKAKAFNKARPQATATSPFSALRIEDAGNIESYKDGPSIKKQTLHYQGKGKSKVGFNLAPTDEFVDTYKKNNSDLKETLKDVDLEKPPVQGEIKIDF